MKKLFFLVAAIALGWLSSSAETYSYQDYSELFGQSSKDFSLTMGQEYTSSPDGNFTFKFSGDGGTAVVESWGTPPTKLDATDCTLTITSKSGNLKSINFNSGMYSSYNDIKSVSAGTISGSTWTGDAQSVTFTLSQLYSFSLTIETEDGGGTVDPTPDPGTEKTFSYTNWPDFLNQTLGATITLNPNEEYTSKDGNFKVTLSAGASINTSGVITAKVSGGSGTLTITSLKGNIKSIDLGDKWVSYSQNGLTGVSSGATSFDGGRFVWTGDAQSVTFTFTSSIYSNTVDITVGEGGGTVDPVEKPEVSFTWAGKGSSNTVTFWYQDLPADKEITFKGKDLKGDITLECTDNITTATTTITKEQAEATDGYAVTFNFNPKVANEKGTVTVKTEGMDDAVITFDSAYAYLTQSIDKFSEVTATGTYIYTGEGLVTFHQTKDMKQEYVPGQGYVTSEVDVNYYFIEDATGAIKLTVPNDITANLNAGDKVTNFKFERSGYTPTFVYTLKEAAPTVVSSGNAVVPTEITLDQLTSYPNRLVTLKNVKATANYNNPLKFTSLGTMLNLVQGETTASYAFRILAGTDMVGYEVTDGEFDLTGLTFGGAYIYPRSSADIVTAGTPVEAPELTIERNGRPVTSSILLSGYAPMVKDVVVKGKNLTGDVTLSCDNEYVSFDKTTLAKADVESEAGATVAITVNPAESGDFKATVKFATAGLDTPAEVTLDTSWSSINVIKKVEKLSEVINKAGTYQVTNDPVTVTYSNWDMYYVYAQNADVALRLDVAAINYGAPADKVLKAGDEIKNFFLLVTAPTEWEPNWTYAINTTDPTTGIPDSYGENRHYYDFVSHDNVITPEVITIDQAEAKVNRVVKVVDVTFQNLTEGQKFETTAPEYDWMPVQPTAYAVKAGGKDGFVKPFTGEIYGTAIPTAAVTVTGIAASGSTVMPYSLACIETPVAGEAELNVSTTTIAMQNAKMPCERKVVLSGKNLTNDVTVKCPEGVTATPATIAAADINAAADGVEVTLLFDIAEKSFNGTVEFECADLDAPKTVTVTGEQLFPLLRAENVAAAKALAQDNYIMLTGEATVTYAVKDNDGKVTSFYMQDDSRAMLVDTEGLVMMGKDFPQPAVGDKVKDVVVYYQENAFSLQANGLGQYLTIASSGNTVATKKVAGEAALTEEDEYLLIEVENARFDVPEGTTVLQSGGSYTLKSSTGEITVNPFKTADGTAIPETRVNVVGIYAPDTYIPNYLVLRPRTSADVTASTAGDTPTAIVTRTFTSADAVAVGQSATIAEYSVEVEKLTADATVTFEGEGADQFTAEPATISKEDGKHTLKVTFAPKAIGTYTVKMNLNFGVEELNTSLTLVGSAYDADKLPEVTLSEYNLNLNAKVGETATKSVMMTMKNCFAPVTITAKDAANTTVTLNSMSVEPSDEPFELVVTFTPTAEGNGIQMFDITTDKIQTVAVLVVNTSTDTGIALVEADADGFFRVYNTNGVLLLETRDSSRLAELTPGLYIINGKKFILR